MKRLHHYLFPLLLLIITLTICFKNYTPATFLTGWDTLHPEFNLPLNLSRVLFGVWRMDQGLGAVAAHAHMSELPRILILWLLSFFFQLSQLRYLYIFLCFILGPLGVYLFLSRLFTHKNFYSQAAGFLGALFYIFNLGTAQHFFVPFEMFPTQYAALPWLFYFVTEFLTHHRRRDLLLFALVSFLSTPMAYASLLWFAYLAGLLLYLGVINLVERKKIIFKKSITLLIVVFVTNAFWILPNIYFLGSDATHVAEAKTNRLFSPEAFIHNKQYGTMSDTLIFKNFLFNWTIYNQNVKFTELLEPWKKHLANPAVSYIGFIAAELALFGAVITLGHKRKAAYYGLLPVGLLAFVMITNMNPPFNWFFDYLRNEISLFKEGLRFPFTKFSILLMFAMSAYFGIFFEWLFESISHVIKRLRSVINSIIICGIGLALMCYGWPFFTGNLIDTHLRIPIPQEYFSLFDWFQKQPNSGRVAPLPIHTLWGWDYTRWGYQGSGFLWFGIPQPFLARDFDRWNGVNEQYFREMQTALYSRDEKLVEKLAQKYQITYFILDESIIAPGNVETVLFYDDLKAILTRSTQIHLAKVFGETLSVYTVDSTDSSYVFAPERLTPIGPPMLSGFHDQAFATHGNYMESKESLKYPIRSLITREESIDTEKIDLTNEFLTIKTPQSPTDSINQTPNLYPDFLQQLYPYDESLEQKSKLTHEFGEIRIQIPIENAAVYLSREPKRASDCGETQTTKIAKRVIEGDSVAFIAESGSSCDYVAFPTIPHDSGAILVVESKFGEGLPTRICVSNHTTKRCDLYTALSENKEWHNEYFVIPPLPDGTSGYDVHVNTVSIGNTKSQNNIRMVNLIPIPYYFLQSLESNDGISSVQNNLEIIKTGSWGNNAFYKVETNDSGTLVVNSTFHPGWKAIMQTNSFPYFQLINEHLVINNWANAWKLESTANSQQSTAQERSCQLSAESCKLTTYILFWPQILEFIGLGLLVVPLLLVLRGSKRG